MENFINLSHPSNQGSVSFGTIQFYFIVPIILLYGNLCRFLFSFVPRVGC